MVRSRSVCCIFFKYALFYHNFERTEIGLKNRKLGVTIPIVSRVFLTQSDTDSVNERFLCGIFQLNHICKRNSVLTCLCCASDRNYLGQSLYSM